VAPKHPSCAPTTIISTPIIKMADNACKDAIPKGTYLPLFHFADSDGIKESTHNNCTLIPSWVSGGLFPLFNDDGPDASFGKRRKQNNHGAKRSSDEQDSHYSNLEQLVAREIRNCDVCGRHALWTQTVYHTYFEPSRAHTECSVADSLPQFIGKYVAQSVIPCRFCTEAHQCKITENPSWCGTLYCSKRCQSIGEATAGHSQLYVPFPKLFFCHNRTLATIETGDRADVQEVLDSLDTIKQRLLSICGANSSEFQAIGMEECALFITTFLCCSYDWKVDKLLHMCSNANDTNQCNLGLDTSEEALVEEIWVLARSHWSLLHANLHISAILETESSNKEHLEASFPSYQNFEHLYTFIKRRCLIRVSPSTHPIVSYTTNTLLSSKKLSDSDRNHAFDTLQVPTMKEVLDTSTSASNFRSSITLCVLACSIKQDEAFLRSNFTSNYERQWPFCE
jgi:hypothetical protein